MGVIYGLITSVIGTVTYIDKGYTTEYNIIGIAVFIIGVAVIICGIKIITLYFK